MITQFGAGGLCAFVDFRTQDELAGDITRMMADELLDPECSFFVTEATPLKTQHSDAQNSSGLNITT
jgi:hypothetical protein